MLFLAVLVEIGAALGLYFATGTCGPGSDTSTAEQGGDSDRGRDREAMTPAKIKPAPEMI